MKLNTLRLSIGAMTLALAGTLIAGNYFVGGEFKVNGNSVSTNFITSNGKVYMPVSDVAAALDMEVVKHSTSSYELVAKGGANQVNGLEGKIGQTFVTSHYKITFSKFFTTDHYQKQFGEPGTADAADGKTLAIVIIQVKNATNRVLGMSLPNGKTMLTDDQEQTYEPSTGGWADWKSSNPDVLPGAAVNFALVTQVPKDAKLKDLIYEINSNVGGADNVFRIHLNP